MRPEDQNVPKPPTSKRKILFVCTEDWFFRSHFMPLGQAALKEGGYDATILTTVGPARADLEELGLRVVPVDFARASFGILSSLRLFFQLVAAFWRERPDIVHIISLKPILIGGLAALFIPRTARVFHLTGLGYVSDLQTARGSLVRGSVFRLLAFFLRWPNSWLITENPDDRAFVAQFGAPTETRSSLFGGAGVDPDDFPELPPPDHSTPSAGYVGRMIWSKGVDIIVEAQSRVVASGTDLDLHMYGAPDTGNHRPINPEMLEEWNSRPGVTWHGLTTDIHAVWRQADMAIVATRTREGMPRAMLEAAACGRALIVSDIPGCRHFVRDGIEGLVVPPEDAGALAEAMERLANDRALCRKMGQAARQRIIDGYTEGHVREAVLKIYAKLLGGAKA